MMWMLAAAGPEETALRFRALPPLWLLFMVIVPAVIAFVWWIYRHEGTSAPTPARRVMGVLRFVIIAFLLALMFQPYAETSIRKRVKSHLVVLLDTSASMAFVDSYSDPEKVEKTRTAADLGVVNPSITPRIELLKGALSNRSTAILDRLAAKFNLHVYTFDAETVLRFSADNEGEDGSATPLVDRVKEIEASGAWTLLGGSVAQVIEEFRLRDEPLSGVVILTDGRQNGGDIAPVEAARKAADSQPRVPLYLIGVGDPDRPRNLHVGNLRAKEVVLRGDDVTFEFSLTNKGFAGELVEATLETIDDDGSVIGPLSLSNAEVVVGEEGDEQVVRVSHRFETKGTFTLRIGIPVRPGEKIENDNYLLHHIQVVDTKIRVLYVEGYPRWEYRFLKDSLTRDTETILAHVVNLDADPSVVQPFTNAPGWKPRQRFPETREELFQYHVVIFGDVDWRKLSWDGDEEKSKECLANLKDFVDEGGGFVMIAGPYDSPRSYRSTDLRDILPVELSRDEEWNADIDPVRSFNLRLTEEGRRHPIMALTEDPDVSAAIWEQEKFSAQFWYYPVTRAKEPPAIVLAEHSGEHNRNTFGPHVLMATMPYGKGQTLFLGVDELWRLRWATGSKYHYRFYGEAIRLLATYKLLGGNLRFKIFTDRNRYIVGDAVEITADVYDRDFQPATAEKQVVTIRMPDGEEETREMALDPETPGRYRLTISVHRSGTYRISAEPADGEEESPQKLFKVEYSTEEMRNPLIDIETMAGMARESGGEFFPLYRIGEMPDRIPGKSVYVASEVRSKDLWDEMWVLFLFTALLAAEWLLRKRYRLL